MLTERGGGGVGGHRPYGYGQPMSGVQGYNMNMFHAVHRDAGSANAQGSKSPSGNGGNYLGGATSATPVMLVNNIHISPNDSTASPSQHLQSDSSLSDVDMPLHIALDGAMTAQEKKDIFQARKRREFIPEFKKDDRYWSKRHKNNEAAKRSREKRRINDMQLSQQVDALNRQNNRLRAELRILKERFNIPLDEVILTEEQAAKLDESVPSLSNSEMDFQCPSQVAMVPKMAEAKEQLAPQMSGSMTSVSSSPAPTAEPPRPHIVSSHMVPPQPPTLPPATTTFSVPMQHPQPTSVVASIPPPSIASPGPANSDPAARRANVQESNEAMLFHSRLKAPDICRPISPDDRFHQHHHLGSSARGEAPLNLSLKQKSATQEEINCKDDSVSDTSTESPNSPTSYSAMKKCDRTSIPHKLRHKVQAKEPVEISSYEQPEISSYEQSSYEHLALELRDINSDDSNESHFLQENSPGESGKDPRYYQRRQRNNMAARKCREARKAVTQMRIAKSNLLESENEKLKAELKHLSVEVSSLKELVEKKQKVGALSFEENSHNMRVDESSET